MGKREKDVYQSDGCKPIDEVEPKRTYQHTGPVPESIPACVGFGPEAGQFSVKASGKKNDEGKLRWDIIQPLTIQEYVKVLTEGAQKYSPDNWRFVPNARSRYFAALMRHVWKWRLGELYDPETGFHHLGHALCCLAFLLEPELEQAKEVCVEKVENS